MKRIAAAALAAGLGAGLVAASARHADGFGAAYGPAATGARPADAPVDDLPPEFRIGKLTCPRIAGGPIAPLVRPGRDEMLDLPGRQAATGAATYKGDDRQ